MRELRILLDLFRNRSVLIKMDSYHHSFFLTSFVEGENKVGIKDNESDACIITDNWCEMADFIRNKGNARELFNGNECIYSTLLILVVVAFVYPDPSMKKPDPDRYKQLYLLAKKERWLQGVLNHVN